MAGVAGLEPVTSAVTGQRSNQLSYTPAKGKLNIKNLAVWVKKQFVVKGQRGASQFCCATADYVTLRGFCVFFPYFLQICHPYGVTASGTDCSMVFETS
jgi:hypothetical protein